MEGTVHFQDQDNVSEVLQSYTRLDDFGLVETEDNACDDRNYLPEVQPEEQDPRFSEEEVMEVDDVPLSTR